MKSDISFFLGRINSTSFLRVIHSRPVLKDEGEYYTKVVLPDLKVFIDLVRTTREKLVDLRTTISESKAVSYDQSEKLRILEGVSRVTDIETFTDNLISCLPEGFELRTVLGKDGSSIVPNESEDIIVRLRKDIEMDAVVDELDYKQGSLI